MNKTSEVFTSERLGEYQTAEETVKSLGGDCLDTDRTATVAAGLEREIWRIGVAAGEAALDAAGPATCWRSAKVAFQDQRKSRCAGWGCSSVGEASGGSGWGRWRRW